MSLFWNSRWRGRGKGDAMESTGMRVQDRDGRYGVIEDLVGLRDRSRSDVLVRLEDGQQVRVPKSALGILQDNTYPLGLRLADLATPAGRPLEQAVVVPVVQEELIVGKQAVETGRVRLVKTVNERQEVIDEPLLRERVEVEHVPVNQVVSGPVAVRYEGDVMIIPVLEEVIVYEKRLVLKEELHVRKVTTQERQPETVSVRQEQVAVERVDRAPDRATAAPPRQAQKM